LGGYAKNPNDQFAPRYKAIQEKVRTALYGFHHPSHYGEQILTPIRKIQTDLIVEEWDNVQRIFVSLARKTTTQSIIVGKLSAYARKNKTRQALWEYDNIIRSLYLLEYIDSPPLRQQVQRALNRGENYHQLRRAVSYANFGKLRFKTEDEQQLWNECCRLITNCIVYYNASIISRLLTYLGRYAKTPSYVISAGIRMRRSNSSVFISRRTHKPYVRPFLVLHMYTFFGTIVYTLLYKYIVQHNDGNVVHARHIERCSFRATNRDFCDAQASDSAMGIPARLPLY
jgi:hypothetical protein